ncbi:MAG TPA: hypothetical protein VND15_02305 [Candidatus Acidoferrales bacterium]|nr:hypothetical protein [Candidatus Acidoferrales bacterium]
MPKAQSAIEFMSGYGFVFLIIAIALAMLFLFSSVPATVLPTQCNFLSGFSCTDAIYTNTPTGSSLFLTAVDTQPGIVNISAFSGYINFIPSNTGACAPAVATSGQVVYCTANFTFRPKLGNIYSGSFKATANYCAGGASNLSTAPCPVNSITAFTYGGNVRAQSSFLPLTGVWQLPVNVINSQSSPVQQQGQIMISFQPLTYNAYEKSDLGNIRFYSGAKELNSWCEYNCTSSSAINTLFWIKLPQGIPANTNTVISMYFMPKTVEYDGIFAGEAPQLSQSYAQYDNGGHIFNGYTTFGGLSALPAGWTNQVSTIAFNPTNMNIMQASGSTNEAVYTTSLYSQAQDPFVLDMLLGTTSSSWFAGNVGLAPVIVGSACSDYATGTWYYTGTIFAYATGNCGVSDGTPITTYTTSTNYLVTMSYVSATNINDAINYGASQSSNYAQGAYNYLSFQVNPNQGSNFNVYWVRYRAYPPNGVMPTTSFGTTSKVG